MIQRIRNSKAFKITCVFLVLNILAEIVAPMRALALTGGPAQPEFSSFTPIGTSDMVDLSSGDMNYNIPLMDVGGYPLNIAYSSGVGMDDEASWVGLGWNLSVGQINRNVRGIPDDFKGDQLTYENDMKPNVTAGANLSLDLGLFGLELPDNVGGSVGVAAMYNSYSGFSMKPSFGMNVELSKNVSVGFNAENGPDGMSLSPNMSIHKTSKDKNNREKKLGGSVGLSLNSRQGLTSTTLNMSKTMYSKELKTKSGTYGNNDEKSKSSVGSSIGFAESSYTPSKRVGMVTGSFTVNASTGVEFFGAESNADITAYGTVQVVKDAEKYKQVQSYGYEHTDKANPYAVTDFNREKESAMTINSTNLPVTNYTYDIYSVQGQGVSGMYRPYRNQVGYVFDPRVDDGSTSASLGLEFGSGNTAHLGVDVEVTDVQSYSGVWVDNNYILNYLKEATGYNPRYEKVHFKNVGDLSVDEEMDNNSSTVFNRTGRYQPVRVSYVGNKFHRRAIGEYKRKINGEGNEDIINAGSVTGRNKRQSRNQAIYNVTVAEVKNGVGYSVGYTTNYCRLNENIANPLLEPYAKTNAAPGHHTGEVQIIRNDGARYIYGLPAYNTVKKEATFAVGSSGSHQTGLVYYNAGVDNSPANSSNDEYFNRVTTPAYAHSYLLTSVLSSDYVDRDANGPSVADYGSYTKFTYSVVDQNYKWRVPYEANSATYNEGLRTNPKDNQGNYVYGEKELVFIRKIETKTHVAIFEISERHDGHGVLGENGGRDNNENTYKLDRIKLFAKPEYDANPTNAIPIKTVHFEYDYSLCPNVPTNDGVAEVVSGSDINLKKGKLTLQKIYFTYRDSKMGKYNSYRFDYNETNTAFNPDYNIKGYDYWGNYKPNTSDGSNTAAELTAAEYPYTSQDLSDPNINNYSSVWCLRKIDLPSGGSINVSYESDDYAYVQDKAAMRMFQIIGVSQTALADVTSLQTSLYRDDVQKTVNPYMYFELGEISETAYIDNSNAKEKLLGGIGKNIQFRFLMNMTQEGGNGITNNTQKCDYVSGYFQLLDTEEESSIAIFTQGTKKYARVKVKAVDRNGGNIVDNPVHPISFASWAFGRKYLNGYVYSMQPNGETDDVQEIVNELLSPQVLSNLKQILMGPNSVLETRLIGRCFRSKKAWIRLKEPSGNKLGGGCRVKQITSTDVWESMNGESPNPAVGYQTMTYGQSYSYKLANGQTSGVATYEPIGNKENPFVQPIFSQEKRLLAPDEENYMEAPFGESFFPNPQVTYSRVTVKSTSGGSAPSGQPNVKQLHKTGSVVTEFYTSKDYPTIVDNTILEAKEDKRNLLDNLLKVNLKKHFTASQGYVIHLNDMNGKQKSQRVYAEGQSTFISGVDYLYDNYSTPQNYNATMYPERNKGTLNNQVKVIYPNGTIGMKTIGVEEDIVHDFMYNETNSTTAGVNVNLATFLAGIIPGIVPVPLPDVSFSEDRFQAVSTTKVINTFGILKETIAYEDGASVSTRNLAWDAMTGEVLVTETVDEFSDKYYTLNYPAHWYYHGMAQASKNLGFNGELTASTTNFSIEDASPYQAGDFLLPGDEIVYGSNNLHGWVINITGNTFRMIDANGNTISTSGTNIPFKVVRSGHRNLQSAGIMNVTLMKNPLKSITGVDLAALPTNYLNSANWEDWKIINAGAVDYTDNWPSGCECGVTAPQVQTTNPYLNNSKGNWRTKSSRTFLTGRNVQASVNPRKEGFFTDFKPMYKLSVGGNWVKDFTGWTFVSQVTRYSPYGFELENSDALYRFSAAQYGYSNTLPMAVGANTRYRQIGYDGFEDYSFGGCETNQHFKVGQNANQSGTYSHTGRYSLKVNPSTKATMTKPLVCP